MTTITLPRATVEQALEALDEADAFHRNLPDQRARRLAAMAALRAALAQRAELVQEPVAWRFKPMIGSPWSLSDDGYYISCKRDKGYIVEPLYAAPPQRKQAEPLNLSDPAVQKRLAAQWGYVPAAQAEPVEPVDVGLLEYRGNSVAFIHQKMTAYRSGIDAAWDAFRAKGLHPDGKTSLADMIAKHTALRAALAQQAEPASADPHTTTLRNLLECCLSWEPDVCVLGSVTARQAITALRAALAQQDESETCTWQQDGDSESSVYATSCRRYFSLDDGTPEDNKMAWCCFCGKKLVQEMITEGDDE